jgi:protein Mpv17
MDEHPAHCQQHQQSPSSHFSPPNNNNNDMTTNLQQGILFAAIVLLLTQWFISGLELDAMRGWTATEMAQGIAMRQWNQYSYILAEYPIQTKAFTSATVYTIGDVLAQQTGGVATWEELDWMRTLRSMLAGLIGHGPMSHVWYNVSEHLFDHVLHWTEWWSVFPKVVLDQAFWSPIWNNSYIILLGLMKRDSASIILGDMKRTTIPLVLSGLKLWPLAHVVTYGVIPVENRLLWVDTVEILWVTILSKQAAGGPDEAGEEQMIKNDNAIINSPTSTTTTTPTPPTSKT